MNQSVDGTDLGTQPTFVNDMIMSEFRYLIFQTAKNSVLPASIFIENCDLVKELISVEKFECFFTHLNETLGFIANSR